jgi:Sel1 repeat
MRGQGSTEPDISAGENTERAFVQELCHWFRESATAWVGTAAELLSELKGRADGLGGECWFQDALAVCDHLERNTELLRSYGFEVHIYQQDNGPRLISIRPLEERVGVETQESQSNSLGIGDADADEKVFAREVMNADHEPGRQQAEGDSGAADQALGESADLHFDATASNVQSNNNDHQQQEPISPSSNLTESSDWHDIRTSLSGFETGNTVPTGIAYRMTITGIVILCFVGVLLLFAWLRPGSFPIALSAHGAEQSNSAAQRSRTQESDTPKISHGDFVASDNGAGNTAAFVPVGVPQLLDQSRLGDADSQYLLGMSYETGNGVEEDFVNAYAWYVIADASGNPRGKDAAKQLAGKLSASDIASVRLKLGSIYASGAYVPRDYNKAYVWFSLAAAGGDPAGEREKSRLAQKMTEQEIAEGNNRVSDWLRKHEKQVR